MIYAQKYYGKLQDTPTLQLYKAVISDIIDGVIDLMFKKGWVWKLPFSLGYLLVVKRDLTEIPYVNRPVDRGLTNKVNAQRALEGKSSVLLRHDNFEFDRQLPWIKWLKKGQRARFKNKNFYKFHPSRGLVERLWKVIRSGDFDDFSIEIKYDER